MLQRSSKTRLLAYAAVWILWSGFAYGQSNVLTYHNDNARTSQNLKEPILSPATLNVKTFGRLMSIVLDGKVDAQPLYVSHLPIPAVGTENVVFAVTEHDSAYAFDANTGRIYWHTSLLGPAETPSDARSCDQVTPEIGATATPVIDLTAGPHGTLYVVAMSKNNAANYYHRLHALDLITGAEEFGGPQLIQASYPGVGANNNNGQVIFDAKQYKDRAGLLLLNGVVYTAWGSHCDVNPYTGWMIGYDHLTLQQTSVFNFAPNGSEAALWNSGGGPAADLQGNIFVSVANGTFDAVVNAQGFPSRGDYGNAFVKLSTAGSRLSATDYWTMYNSVSESGYDVDLGSGGLLLLPDEFDARGNIRHLAVGAGKDTNLYVIDRDNMGKYDASFDGTIYQQLTGALPGGIWSTPAYFNNHVYFGPVGSGIQAFSVSNASLRFSSASTHSFGYPGTSPSISANGAANGILWAVENTNPAVLHAYDATNLGSELFNSNQAAFGRDHLGAGNKFITPTVANGQVFIGTTTGVGVFGPLPILPLPNGTYSMTGQLSMLALESVEFNSWPGSSIVQWSPGYGVSQRWGFASNNSDYYTIKNLYSNLYLASAGLTQVNGTRLEQLSGDGSDAQLWSLSASGSGYVIKNKASNLVIDDPGFSVQPGAVIQLWGATGNSNQAWLIR